MTVRETCDQIWLQLKDTYMPTPTEDIWKRMARRFNERWNFPNCIGALGKHVKIEAPANTGPLFFYYYEGTFSIVLLALVDADYRFLAIDVGSYGGNSDGDIFADSVLGRALQRGTLNVPPPLEHPSAPELGKVNHVIVADEAFPMKPYLLQPYGGKRLEEDKRIFNLRLSRERRISENVFIILTQRFRVYKRPMDVNSDLSIVKATCILCNFLHHEVVGQVGQGDSFDLMLAMHVYSSSRGQGATVHLKRLSTLETHSENILSHLLVRYHGSTTVCGVDSDCRHTVSHTV